MNKTEQHYLKKELYELIKTDESIFDFIQEASLDGLWYWDLKNPEHEWMNPKFWVTLGYDPDDMPHKASAWQDIIYPDDLKLAADNAQKHCENPDYSYDQVVRYKHKNGNTVWVRCRGMAIRDEDGKAIRMLGAHNDVTKEIETAIKWKKDHEMLLSVLGKQSVYIIKTDLQGNYTYVNNYFCQRLGVSKEEVIGKSSITHIVPQDRPKYNEVVKKCIAQKNTPHKVTLKKQLPNNEFLTNKCVISSFFYEDKEAEELLCVGYDITEQKKNEEALQIAHQRLTSHLNNSPLGIVEYTRDLNVTRWSKKCEEIFEWSEDEILNNSITAFNLIYKEDLPETDKVAKELMSGKVEGNISYNRNYTKSGRIVHCVWYNSVIKDEGGKVISVMSLVQDITRQKLNEQVIRENRQKLANLISNLPGMVYRCKNDRNWTMEYLSDECKEVLGYHKDDLIGNEKLSFNGLIHPEDREYVWQEVQNAILKKQRFEIRYRIKDKKGVQKWVWEKGVGIEDEQGSIIALEGFIQDITEQKEANEKIRLSNERFELIAKTTNDALYEWNMETREIWWSEAHFKLFGFDPAKPIPTQEVWLQRLHPVDREKLLKRLERIHSNQLSHWQDEIRFLKENNQYGTVLERGFVIRGEKQEQMRIMGSFMDITERKNSEREIIQEKELSDSIINSLPGVFYLYNEKGQFLRWNKNFETVTGYSGEEIKKMHPIELFDAEEQDLLKSKIANVFIEGGDHVEANFLLKNKQKIPYYFTGIAGTYKGETCLMGVGIDIADRKEAEESLKQLLNITTEQNERLKEFSFITSHNIRSSVANLLGLVQVIEIDFDNEEYIKMLKVTAEKLDKTVKNLNHLLNFEEIYNQQESVECNLAEIIQRAIALNKPVIEEKQIQIKVNVNENLTIKAIPAFSDSIFYNLISNAIKYGVTQHSKRIEVFAEEKEYKTLVYIKDYGLGLDIEKNKAKLFKLGSRFHTSISDGQGLGLYMTKRQIEGMGGSIEVSSSINKGTVFKVCFYDQSNRHS